MSYVPKPLPTRNVELGPELVALLERVAEHVHETWAAARVADGWAYGPERNDARRETPNLVSYRELPESEKEYDRVTARETLRAIVLLGYRIER